MEKKLDLRIQKTYRSVTNTFLQMMEEMPFEEIRVNELCERAMIRKATFYKHFADKYELMAFVVKEILQKFEAALDARGGYDDRIEYYTQLVGMIIDFAAENKTLIRSALQSNSLSLIMNIMYEQIVPEVKQSIQRDASSGIPLPADPEIMACFFVGGLTETVRTWLTKKKPIDDPALKVQLESILKQFYYSGANEKCCKVSEDGQFE